MSARHPLLWLSAAGVLLALKMTSAPCLESAPGYFGEPVPGLSRAQAQSSARGFELFIKTWSEGDGSARNASSCLACHNTPMPGGSGIYPQTLVQIDTAMDPGDRLEIVQAVSVGGARLTTEGRLERRRAPPLFGLGSIEKALSDDDARSPPHGAFGVYAKVTSLEKFVSLAFADELGVSTSRDCSRRSTRENYPTQCAAVVTEENLQDVANFLRFLAPPPRKTPIAVTPGELIFRRIGCNSCHAYRGLLPTEVAQTVAWFEEPLSDFQLHRLGTTARSQVRTAPLWGLRSVGPPYLHDGSADSIEAAVLSHGGEAETVRERYAHLASDQVQALMTFLGRL